MTRERRGNATRLTPHVFLIDDDDARANLPMGALALRVLPSRAFGDGSHPTTRLMVRVVDLLLARGPSSAFLDVGTGTGVLARVARARGASFVVATDIDAHARETARAHAALDGHDVEIVVSDAQPDAWGARFDVVVANILAPVLCTLAPALAASVADGGRLALSGFTRAETPILRVAFGALGFVEERTFVDEEWVVMVLARSRGP